MTMWVNSTTLSPASGNDPVPDMKILFVPNMLAAGLARS
jgi:hypothetical protein